MSVNARRHLVDNAVVEEYHAIADVFLHAVSGQVLVALFAVMIAVTFLALASEIGVAVPHAVSLR